MTKYFSCAVPCRNVRSPQETTGGSVEFLVINYQSVHPKTGKLGEIQIKFPGGGLKYHHEYPGQTMAREVFEETSLCVYHWKKEWSVEVTSTHTQYGFLVDIDDCLGDMRQEEMIDDDGDLLSAPYWVRAEVLGHILFPKHLPHYMEACRELGIEPASDPNHSP
ncbi:MAG: NUDIX hydrolase [bacterium]|nr:NUDIX hydrolase [bacterium]